MDPNGGTTAARLRTRRSSAALLALVALVALVALLALLAALGSARAEAKSFQPPRGKVFTGTSDTGQTSDYAEFRELARAHPAILQSFEVWGLVPHEAIRRWDDVSARGMLSLSTGKCWGCPAVINLSSIANGKGDRYLLALARALKKRSLPTYIRLFPEMNGFWNAYSAVNQDGTKRGSANSTKSFRRAWQRTVLLVRGGKRAAIERKLHKLGMPKIKAKTQRRLPSPKVAFAWVPQASGTPNVPGNGPKAYFPGYDYIDWVGADIYGQYANFAGLTSLYNTYKKRPFMVPEWSPWNIDNPDFVSQLFNWIDSKERAKMLVYYQDFGEGVDNEFELTDYPDSLKRLRKRLNTARYLPFAPGEK